MGPIERAALPRAALAWSPAIAWACVIFYLSSRSVVPEPSGADLIPFRDKAYHILEYGALGALTLLGMLRGASVPRVATRRDELMAAALATVYGITDEVHQAFVPLRQADATDLLFDAAGALLACLLLARYVAPRAAASPPAAA